MGMHWLLSLVLILGVACDSSIAPKPDKDTDDGEPTETDVGEVQAGEVVERTIDASDTETWAYLDLDKNALVMPAKPAAASDWDLSFKRFTIATNGGGSGSGGVEVAVLKEAKFDDVIEVSANGFASDATDGSDDDEEPEYVMSTGESGWYDYDPTAHTLSPRAHVYLVRTTTRAVFKLEILDYYSEAGSSGYLTMRFAQLAAGEGGADGNGNSGHDTDAVDAGGESNADAGALDPEDAGESDGKDAGSQATFSSFTVDASAADAWVYVAVAKGVVPVTDPQVTPWDIAFQRTRIQTNSGTSGPGMGGAQRLGGSFDDVVDVPSTDGFDVDALMPIPGPPGSGEFSGNPVLNGWYDYNPTTHAISPKAQSYLVRTASGAYAKLRITSYAGGVFNIDLGTLGD